MSQVRRKLFFILSLLLILTTASAVPGLAQGQLGNVTKTWNVPGGNVTAGDTITYTVTIPNVGDAPLNDVVFSDFPDPLTQLVNGSVTTTAGNIVVGNGAGDSNIVVEVGTIAAGGSVTITFEVVVFEGIAYPVTVHNQGFVNSDNGNTPTDDPDTDPPDDPTDTPVDPQDTPEIGPVLKECALHDDVDSGGRISVGDTIRYTVSIPNTGNVTITDATFTDTLDPNTSLVVGSVTTSQGSVISGNNAGDTTVVVALGTLNTGSTATVTFDVVVNNNVGQVSNQGFVDFPGGTVPTDDPSTSTPNDPTVCQVFPVEEPEIDSMKAVTIIDDLDGTGNASPGDTLRYTITITNKGNIAVDNISFTDVPDSQTTLNNGSVTTSIGTVITGNSVVDDTIEVNVGTLGAGQSAVIRFNVTINAGATGMISNQGITNTPDGPTPTDDPDTDPPDDPTDTPVTPQETPELGNPTKNATLQIDADSSNSFSVGDTVRYTIRIPNTGLALYPDVVFTDTPDASTTLVVGSVTTSHGTVITGNTVGDTTVRVNIGDLPGGETATIRLDVTINPGATNIRNQGIVETPDGPTPTDDPGTTPPGDPTDTPVRPQGPPIDPVKEFRLLNDLDNSGRPSPGDVLRYTIRVPNMSLNDIAGVVFTDTLDPNTTLMIGTVSTSKGTVEQGNSPGDSNVRVNIGTLNARETVTITFDASINAGAERIINQAFVDAPAIEREPTDNPRTPEPDDPTITAITPTPLARCEFELVSRLASTVLVVQFEDASLSNGTDIVDWMWDFGDGGTCNRDNMTGCSAKFGDQEIRGTLQNPVHLFDGLGRFVIKLKVTDSNGTDNTHQCAFTFGDPTVTEVLDENANAFIDDAEVIKAIDYWIMGKPIPNTGGKVINDKMIMSIIDLWIKRQQLGDTAN